MTLLDIICLSAFAVIVLMILHALFKYIISPKVIDSGIKYIERNPKWITSKLHSEYYGFDDIDFVIVESKFGHLPRFRAGKEGKSLELLIPEDTSTKDVEAIGSLALAGKMKIKYGIFLPGRPIYWLSVLCYMLDGGDINENAVSWKPILEQQDEKRQ